MQESLKDVCEKAFAQGQKTDLSDCLYGTPHWPDKIAFTSEPEAYYYFLTGFVRTRGLTRLLDIGTHYGGSIKAMYKGVSGEDLSRSILVTVDVTYEGAETFEKFPQIKRVRGDSLDKGVIGKIASYFNGRGTDMVFIDSEHVGEYVWRNMKVYSSLLRPRYIILDDIHQNSSMEKLWRRISRTFAANSFDASGIMGRNSGIGVIETPSPFKLINEYDYWLGYNFSQAFRSVKNLIKGKFKAADFSGCL